MHPTAYSHLSSLVHNINVSKNVILSLSILQPMKKTKQKLYKYLFHLCGKVAPPSKRELILSILLDWICSIVSFMFHLLNIYQDRFFISFLNMHLFKSLHVLLTINSILLTSFLTFSFLPLILLYHIITSRIFNGSPHFLQDKVQIPRHGTQKALHGLDLSLFSSFVLSFC